MIKFEVYKRRVYFFLPNVGLKSDVLGIFVEDMFAIIGELNIRP